MRLPCPSCLRPLSWLLGLAVLALPPAHAVERAELEAAIVYNLLQYVEWPAEALPAAGGALELCLAQGSPLRGPVKSLEGRPVGPLRLAVRTLEPAEAPHGCHVLFIDGDPPTRHRPPRATALLLIGDGAAQSDDGITIRLAQADGRMVFEVDLVLAREARLQVSSRLLRLARKVNG
ncbi:MAG TPA: YfiR family protein [Ideonella sp.]|uniref:YfiR family protein n=1 Tax=Ideonella sp. TaxID=1929293 RepID=UPI002C04F042|nr:YfiR family protein [Ideonella sp.]HSI47465.1 YfiR family protein [Ideonella sp.]